MSNALIAGDLLKVRLWCTNAEQASVQTFYYSVLATGTPAATDIDVANSLDTGFFSTAMPPLLNNLSSYEGVQVQIYRLGMIFVSANATTGHGVGTGGAVALPRQTAGITHLTTALAGRAYRGRSYWPFPSVTHDQGDGVPTSAYASLIGTAIGGLLLLSAISTAGRTATIQMVLNHRKNKAGVIPPITPIVLTFAEQKWATQRRRGSFGRPNVSPI